MLSALVPVLFALLHMAFAAPTSDSKRLQKRLDTGPIVAISLCVPVGALVIGLGIGILWLYPKQLRKLREQNPGREIGFADLMNGGVSTHAPPAYKEHEGSEHELDTHNPTPQDTTSQQSAPQQSTPPYSALQPPPDARHAALAV